jgi:plastocyanin
MRSRLVTVLLATAMAVAFVGTASASVSAKKPPVKVPGGATNKGTTTVKNDAATIEADDFYFKKTFQKVTAGQTVAVTIENEGGQQHTFTIDGLGVDEVINPGKSATVDVAIPADGTPLVFYCRFHGDPGKMKGAFFTKKGTTTSTSIEDSGGGSGNSGSGSGNSGGSGGYGY